MKLLILGGGGMAGHVLVKYFKSQGRHTVFYTTRNTQDHQGLLLDATDDAMVRKVIQLVSPDVIINAIGILNQYADQDRIQAYEINGLLPHRLQRYGEEIGARLIHISTDCVYSGHRGSYKEDDVPDGTSAYSLTKTLGEIKEQGHVTIRTSIIGPEISSHGIGLMHWFLNSRHQQVSGYNNVFWNGVTTLELAKAIDKLLDSPISGLIHLCHPNVISKHDLLVLFKQIWGLSDIEIDRKSVV